MKLLDCIEHRCLRVTCRPPPPPLHPLGVWGRHLRIDIVLTVAARRDALNPKPETLNPKLPRAPLSIYMGARGFDRGPDRVSTER